MDESKNAQLVIQHTQLQKLKQTIIANKEKEKEKDTTVFKKGLGWHVTDPKLIQAITNKEQEKEAEVQAKGQRMAIKKARRAAKAAAKDEWKTIKAAHESAVTAWKLACTELKVAGRPIDLPLKLKRPPKPKPVLKELPAGNKGDVEGSDLVTSDDE